MKKTLRKRDRRTNEWAQERRCLKCRRLFGSDSPFNRVCRACKGTNERVGGIYRARFG